MSYRPTKLGTIMTGKLMIYAGVVIVLTVTYFGWKLTARGAYESAEYTVLDSESPFEIREYPELMLATTNTQLDLRGDDGSFMRLFRYISGANDAQKKIEMTCDNCLPTDWGWRHIICLAMIE